MHSEWSDPEKFLPPLESLHIALCREHGFEKQFDGVAIIEEIAEQYGRLSIEDIDSTVARHKIEALLVDFEGELFRLSKRTRFDVKKHMIRLRKLLEG